MWILFNFLALFLCHVNADPCTPSIIRSYDGTCNNLVNPTLGSAGTYYIEDFKSETSLENMPVARNVTNLLHAERPFKPSALYTSEERVYGLSPNDEGLNVLINGFAQLIGHDLSLAKQTTCFSPDCFIFSPLAEDDPLYMTTDEYPEMPVDRKSLFVLKSTFDVVNGTKYFVNEQTSFLDGSVIYGASESVASGIRTHVDGKLIMRTDVGDLEYGELPDSGVTGTPNQCSDFGPFGLASGDRRTETNSVLASLHTLFAREHNRIATALKDENPSWTDEELYQEARKFVVAFFQHIAVNEFAPAMFGRREVRLSLGRYSGYDPEEDPSLSHIFGLSASRVPHDQVSLPMLLLFANGSSPVLPTVVGFPDLERINCVADEYWRIGTNSILRGNVAQYAQKFDGKVVDDVRSFPAKITTPLPINYDIKVMDLEREREANVSSYYHVRKALTGEDLYTMEGCFDGKNENPPADPIECFLYITHNATAAHVLKDLYQKIDRVDLHTGLLTESDRTSSGFPRLAAQIWLDQLQRSRDSDRLWYENYRETGLFTPREFSLIRRTRLDDVILRNSALTREEVNHRAFYIRGGHSLF